MESKTEHSENPFLQKKRKKERKAPKSFDDQTRTTISSHKLPLRPVLRKTTDEKEQVLKRKANTEYKSPVPRLQTRKGSSCEFFFFADIKAPNNSNFWPNSTPKKQFRNTNKQASKQASKTPPSIKDKMLKMRRPKRPRSANSVQQEGRGGGEAMIVGTEMHRATGDYMTAESLN